MMGIEPRQFHHDFFVSHASEDKELVARPLALALRKRGFNVWYDEFSLQIGDNLRASIDRGLATSRRGIVVLSEAFFAKSWPQRELDGLVAREVVEGVNLILPVWHGLGADEVTSHSPSLSTRVAGRTDDGIEALADRLAAALKPVGEADKARGESQQSAQLHRSASSLWFTPAPRGVATRRVKQGSELVRVAASSHEMHLNVDEVPAEHKQMAADFLEELDEVDDFVNDLGFGEQIRIEQRFDDLLAELERDDLYVWIGTYERELVGPDGRQPWPGAVAVVKAGADGSPASVRETALEGLGDMTKMLDPFISVSQQRKTDRERDKRLPGLSLGEQKRVDDWFDENREAILKLKAVHREAESDTSDESLVALNDALELAANLCSSLLALDLPILRTG